MLTAEEMREELLRKKRSLRKLLREKEKVEELMSKKQRQEEILEDLNSQIAEKQVRLLTSGGGGSLGLHLSSLKTF